MEFPKNEGAELNQVEDILVKDIEDVKAVESSIDYHLDKYWSLWENYLSVLGELAPLMRLKLGIPQK
jgi:hypothetical protein